MFSAHSPHRRHVDTSFLWVLKALGGWCLGGGRLASPALFRAQGSGYNGRFGRCHFRDHLLFGSGPIQGPVASVTGNLGQEVAIAVAVKRQFRRAANLVDLSGLVGRQNRLAILDILKQDSSLVYLLDLVGACGKSLRADSEIERNGGGNRALRQQSNWAQ